MNDIVVAEQVYAFAAALALGAVLCFAYDILRVLHRYVCRGKVAIFILDLLFWIITALGTLFVLIIFCKGYLRAYVFFGEILGFVIFRLSLSSASFFILDFLFRAVRRVFEILMKPVFWAFEKIKGIFVRVSGTLDKFFEKIMNDLKKRKKISNSTAKKT